MLLYFGSYKVAHVLRHIQDVLFVGIMNYRFYLANAVIYFLLGEPALNISNSAGQSKCYMLPEKRVNRVESFFTCLRCLQARIVNENENQKRAEIPFRSVYF